MENQNKNTIEELIKTLLDNVKQLKEEREQTELNIIIEKLNKIEVELNTIRKAII